jgi:hypothetical protein
VNRLIGGLVTAGMVEAIKDGSPAARVWLMIVVIAKLCPNEGREQMNWTCVGNV